nr:AraC family transcriptional regulator [uncultured Allomuricauda sp.]
MVFLILIGIGVLSIFLLFVLLKEKKILSDYYLIAIILFFAGILGSHLLMINWPSIFVYLIILFFNTYYFPILIIYGLILLHGNTFNKKWIWIYACPIVYTILILIDLFLFNDYELTQNVEKLFINPSQYQFLLYLTQYIYVIVLLAWLLKKLNGYTKKIKNYFSSIEHINLRWFRYFVIAFLSLSSIGFVVFTSFSMGFIENIDIPFGIEYVIFIALLFYLCYNGIRQYSLTGLRNNFLNSQIKDPQKNSSSAEKYTSSNLTNENIESYFKEILQLFDEEEIFLESQLKIEDVAKKLDISLHKVSQVINSKSNKTFFDFVNHYRVEYFKRLLSEPDKRKFTILSLGIESGFNSKASMNRVFKNIVGQSPKEFQQNQSKEPIL